MCLKFPGELGVFKVCCCLLSAPYAQCISYWNRFTSLWDHLISLVGFCILLFQTSKMIKRIWTWIGADPIEWKDCLESQTKLSFQGNDLISLLSQLNLFCISLTPEPEIEPEIRSECIEVYFHIDRIKSAPCWDWSLLEQPMLQS